MKAFRDVPVYLEGVGIRRVGLRFGEKTVGAGSEAGDEIVALPGDAVVLPGFLDEHVHGAGGADAMDATRDALCTISATLAKEGVTGFLATTMTQTPEKIKSALAAVKAAAQEGTDGARILGVHLEGPFLSYRYRGAQCGEYLAKPSAELFDEFYRASGGLIKIVTLAPEEEGADGLIARIRARKVIASIGHTAATYADVVRAAESGATQFTHTFNAQSSFHHREIGAAGCALLFDDLACELIADGVHVSVPAMKLLFKCKPKGKVLLVTDALRAKGLKEGESELGGQSVFVKDGEARLTDGTLAGSVLTMNRAVRNAVEKVGLSLEEAADCASRYPAENLGLYGETGGIAPGKRADYAVLDSKFDVVMTVCGGRIVYRRED